MVYAIFCVVENYGGDKQMKRLIQKYILSEDIPLEGRTFNIITMFGSLGGMLAFIMNLFTIGATVGAFSIFALSAIMMFLVWIANKTGKYQLVGFIVFFIILCIFYPIVYFGSGGILSGMPCWFILGIVVLFASLRGKYLAVMTVISLGVDLGCVMVEYFHPEWIVRFENHSSSQLMDVVVAYNVVALVSGFGIYFQYQVYRRAQKKVNEAAKTKSDFLANMSHEIRTPINAILGMNEMIMRENHDEDISEYAMNIHNSGRMLLSLINDILDFSKIESGRMEIIPGAYTVSGLVCELEDMLRDRAESKGLRFDLEIDTEMPDRLYGDVTRIKQVAMNLLTNAIKYTDRGYVVFRVYSIGTPDFQLVISVKDTGSGIKKEDEETIFDSFRRVDEQNRRNTEGTGLGLTITRRIIELMDGRLDVESEWGYGSTFTAYIPQTVTDEECVGDYRGKYRNNMKKTADTRRILTAPQAHIMLVDDNSMNRIVIEKLLRRTQIQVDSVGSGVECVKSLREMARNGSMGTGVPYYHMILMDHMMPGMDGIETLHVIREEGLADSVPIVALTANAISGVREMYLEEGFTDYLAKPISGAELENAICKYLPPELVQFTDEKLSLTEKDPSKGRIVGQAVDTGVADSAGQGTEAAPEEHRSGFVVTEELAALIDLREALEHSPCGMQGVKENIEIVIEGIPPLCDQIMEAYEAQDWKNYGISVHAMKSVFATIGAGELAAEARKMELAAKEERTEVIREKTDPLIRLAREFISRIQLTI